MTDTDNKSPPKYLFPKRIKVSGFPFMLQGWNTVYEKTTEISDECPVYYLESYTLYWLITIIGVRIFRDKGVWRMQRDHDMRPMSFNKYGSTPQGDPFGYWSNDVYVQPA